MTARRYRKKPVEVEAILFDGDNVKDVWLWAKLETMTWTHDKRLLIPTLEGGMEASPGDYIIRGTGGELYPCKPDRFEETYEDADKPDLFRMLAQEMLDHFEFEKYEQLGLQCQYCLWVSGREWDPVHDCVLKQAHDRLA